MVGRKIDLVYDLYYDMEKEYSRAVALEATGSLLYWMAFRHAISEKTAQKVWDELNGEHSELFVCLSVRYPYLKGEL